MAVKSEALERNQDPFTPDDINHIREESIFARHEQPPIRRFPITIVDLAKELPPGQKTANGFNIRRPR